MCINFFSCCSEKILQLSNVRTGTLFMAGKTGGNGAVVTLCPYYGSKAMLTTQPFSPFPSLFSLGPDTAYSSLDAASLIRNIQGSTAVELGHKQEKASFILK